MIILTIYLDIVFIENVCMNYIILFATGIINKTKTNIIKLLSASILGSAYVVVSYMNILEAYSNFFIKLLLSVCMVYIAYTPKNIKSFIKHIIIFYLTSFTFGGVAFALLYFVRPQDILMKNGVLVGTYPIKIALLGGVVGFAITIIAFKNIKGKLSKQDIFCTIQIKINDNILKIKAIIDTGNLLKEPITGKPVIIVEKQMLESILPKTILDNMQDIINGKIPEELNLDTYISRFRVIPFTSLGKENGLLLGMKVDNIIIEKEETEKKMNEVIMGIYDKNLTKNGLYHALIGLDILEGGKQNEYNELVKK